MLSLDYDQLGSRREECSGAFDDVALTRRDEKDDGRVFQVIGSEDETAVTVVAVVIDSGACKAAFDQLAFEVVRYGTAPTSVKDDVVLHRLECCRGERCAVIEAERERDLGNGLILLQVHVRLEDLRKDGKVGQRRAGGYETVVDILHRDHEGLVRAGLQEDLTGFVPVGVREVDSRGLVGIDFQGSSGGKNDIVVMSTLADQQYFSRFQCSIADGVERVGRDAGGHSATGSVEESRKLSGSLGTTGTGRDERLRRIGEKEVLDGIEVGCEGLVDNGLKGGLDVCHMLVFLHILSGDRFLSHISIDSTFRHRFRPPS